MVRKSVIPAAGLGTRFLPFTKAQPKEMLPIVDTPTIQYVVEEAVEAGIRDILIVTSRGKDSIIDHFDRAFVAEDLLTAKGKHDDADRIKQLAKLARIHFIRQVKMMGLADAVRCARAHVGAEPFVVMLGDAIIQAATPCAGQLSELYRERQMPIIAVEEVPWDKVDRYGIVEGKQIADDVYQLTNIVEKPNRDSAPSNLAVAARYLLTPDIFECIDQTAPGLGGEIQLTDALRLLLTQRPILAYKFQGRRHDVGDRLDFLKTTVRYGVAHQDIGDAFRVFLRDFLNEIEAHDAMGSIADGADGLSTGETK